MSHHAQPNGLNGFFLFFFCGGGAVCGGGWGAGAGASAMRPSHARPTGGAKRCEKVRRGVEQQEGSGDAFLAWPRTVAVPAAAARALPVVLLAAETADTAAIVAHALGELAQRGRQRVLIQVIGNHVARRLDKR